MVDQLNDQGIVHIIDSFQARFFSDLRNGQSGLVAFLSTWQAFESTFRVCSNRLQLKTLERVYSFSALVASVVEGLSETISLSDQLCDDVSAALDVPEPPCDDRQKTTPRLAPYVRLASEWLSSNIHDPYPSQQVRASLAVQTSSSKKDVDNWFIDARKRVGWNDLRRKHFDNKRALIVDAAKRFFLDMDPSRPLSLLVESELAGIQLRANELYSGTFVESPLALQLDRSTTHMAPSIKTHDKGTGPRRGRRTLGEKAACSYPTPRQSPKGESSPLVMSPAPSLPEIPTPTFKRRNSQSSGYGEQDEPPSKRQRTAVAVGEAPLTSSPIPSLSGLPATSSKGAAGALPELDEDNRCPSNSRRSLYIIPETQLQSVATVASPEDSLPSPVESTFDSSELPPPQHYTDSNATTTPTTLKRKRNPSEMEGSSPKSKRLQMPTTTSRVQAAAIEATLPNIQDATAVEFQWDQLLNFSRLPPPVSDWSADMAGPVDVSLFDFSAWDDFDNGTSGFSQGSSSRSSNVIDKDVANGFAPPPINRATDNLLFNWDSYGSSHSSAEQSSNSGTGYFGLDGGSYDVTSLSDQLMTPLPIHPSFGCLPTFTLSLRPSQQNMEPPAEDTSVALPKAALEAKEAKLRALQAEVAALTAEISAAS